MKHRFSNSPARRSGGFTLIEIMVSVTVLSIGLLGLAGLQATALRNNQSAFMRTQASLLAYDLADRMRANPDAVTAGAYSSETTTASATSDCSTTTGCSTTAMAANDLYEWTNAVTTYLPLGQGYICIDSTPADGSGANAANAECDGVGSIFAIKLWWDDNHDGEISGNERFVMSFQP